MKPYFRKLTDTEQDRFDACNPDFTWIAELQDVDVYDINGDAIKFDVEIVVNKDEQIAPARMCFYFHSKDKRKMGDFNMYCTLEHQTSAWMRQTAREIMEVNKLSKVTFLSNKFEEFFI